MTDFFFVKHHRALGSPSSASIRQRFLYTDNDDVTDGRVFAFEPPSTLMRGPLHTGFAAVAYGLHLNRCAAPRLDRCASTQGLYSPMRNLFYLPTLMPTDCALFIRTVSPILASLFSS